MYLRKLELKDAPLMLQWMKDENVVGNLQADFSSKSIVDCQNFIKNAQDMTKEAHFAIASDKDEYMGTVSLKHIDRENNTAEFAIAVRREAMGRGYSWYGMETIIKKAFEEFGLEAVYWCVCRHNKRAVRFYDKHGFHEAVDIPEHVLLKYKEMDSLKWYSILKGDVLDDRKFVAGCRIMRIKTVPTLNAGELSFFEGMHDVDFEIKRIYYISKVPEGVRRGFHAHRELKQLLFCPYGKIQLILENKKGREEITLSDPSIGVVIDKPTWREMLWLQKDSVLCVAASEYYDEEDYIRDYDQFNRMLKEDI